MDEDKWIMNKQSIMLPKGVEFQPRALIPQWQLKICSFMQSPITRHDHAVPRETALDSDVESPYL
jgi:hypothetical protein